MKTRPLPVILDRLVAALEAHFPKAAPRRHQALAIAAYAFGHRDQNGLTAAAKAGELDVEPVEVVAIHPTYAFLRDVRAGAVFAVETSFLEQVCADERRERFVTSPYGNLVDVGPALDAAFTVDTRGTADTLTLPADMSGVVLRRGGDRHPLPDPLDEAALDRSSPGWRIPFPLRGGGTAALFVRDGRLKARVAPAYGSDWAAFGAARDWPEDRDGVLAAWQRAHRIVLAETCRDPAEDVATSPTGLDVSLSGTWLGAALGRGADLRIELSRLLGDRVLARFQPQAWIRDHAVDVDAEGETVFDATDAMDAMVASGWNDPDLLLGDARAPAWAKAWSGPFEVRPETDADGWVRVLSRGPGL